MSVAKKSYSLLAILLGLSMGLNCQYGIAQSKRNIWLADLQQECSMFHTWASSPSEATKLDSGSRVYQLREFLPLLQAVAVTHIFLTMRVKSSMT